MFSKKNDSDIFSNLDSAVSSKENWEKIFFRKHPVLVRNLLPFKNNFFSIKLFTNLDLPSFHRKTKKNFSSNHFVLVRNLLPFK